MATSTSVSGTNATPDQLDFTEFIVSGLTANGVVEVAACTSRPS